VISVVSLCTIPRKVPFLLLPVVSLVWPYTTKSRDSCFFVDVRATYLSALLWMLLIKSSAIALFYRKGTRD
jgi:hypothetical protein